MKITPTQSQLPQQRIKTISNQQTFGCNRCQQAVALFSRKSVQCPEEMTYRYILKKFNPNSTKKELKNAKEILENNTVIGHIIQVEKFIDSMMNSICGDAKEFYKTAEEIKKGPANWLKTKIG